MGFVRFIFTKVFLKHFIISIAVSVVLILLLLLGLRIYTHHGQTIIVPDLKGLTVSQINSILTQSDLSYEIIDSVYTDSVPKSTLAEQIPSAGFRVKPNRTIYLIMNSSGVQTVLMPDLTDLSIRQAYTTLEALGLHISDTIYVPSEFEDLVIGQHFNRIPIEPGTPIAVDSYIDIIVSSGLSSETSVVPNLFGVKTDEAKIVLEFSGFHLGAIVSVDEKDDEAPEEENKPTYIIGQKPPQGNEAYIGSSITVWITTDSLKLITDSIVSDSIFYEYEPQQ